MNGGQSSISNQPKPGSDENDNSSFQWTTAAIVQSIAIFILAGFAEIIGGWLVWAAVKGIRMDGSGVETDENSETHDTVRNDTTPVLAPDNDVVDTESASEYSIIKKPWYFALLGSMTLVAYGFIPCLQPSSASDGFARIYAAYGGFFIIMSFLLGWALEGQSAKPDVGDFVGGVICLIGVFVIMFWPGR
mmetsp:Transcript_7741/g.16572  ORF Transcript_7741/g.16572 Transcript_7741/m.16572 type:complete len:190 (+) Transcript_7741:192-761(+)|eukprot:CAMPEP_0171406594 /NCGR_PEP_ID=MMETSP0880-20121228/18047_1 /TAXON_ID=67004 /ORGANISM="Thalassiosira weissflogii, Strain CCMP1336" /LENGTH=189 /DNA_ID=CAMNT_0011922319 /DNA_START=159 /DNA_END=728 /DNA_ORIENTATION=-